MCFHPQDNITTVSEDAKKKNVLDAYHFVLQFPLCWNDGGLCKIYVTGGGEEDVELRGFVNNTFYGIVYSEVGIEMVGKVSTLCWHSDMGIYN